MSENLRNLIISVVQGHGTIDFDKNTKLVIDAIHEFNELIAGIDRNLLIKTPDLMKKSND